MVYGSSSELNVHFRPKADIGPHRGMKAGKPIDFAWLRGRSVSEVIWADGEQWLFRFDDGTQINTGSAWRIVQDSKNVLGSEDHRQKYGLPAPIDAVTELLGLLREKVVVGVSVHTGTKDLSIDFSSNTTLQIIAFARGYECWVIYRPGWPEIVAMPAAG